MRPQDQIEHRKEATGERKKFKLPGEGWKRSLLAVLLGNLIYHAFIEEQLNIDRSQLPELALGLTVDFWICVMIYGLIRWFFPRL